MNAWAATSRLPEQSRYLVSPIWLQTSHGTARPGSNVELRFGRWRYHTPHFRAVHRGLPMAFVPSVDPLLSYGHGCFPDIFFSFRKFFEPIFSLLPQGTREGHPNQVSVPTKHQLMGGELEMPGVSWYRRCTYGNASTKFMLLDPVTRPSHSLNSLPVVSAFPLAWW